MIRELINNFDIEVGHLEIEVTEQKPDEFTCVISIFDSSGGCEHEVELSEPVSCLSEVFNIINEILITDNVMHLALGHSCTVKFFNGVLEVMCLSSMSVKHDEYVFWQKPNLSDPSLSTMYLMEYAHYLLKEKDKK